MVHGCITFKTHLGMVYRDNCNKSRFLCVRVRLNLLTTCVENPCEELADIESVPVSRKTLLWEFEVCILLVDVEVLR